MENNLYILEDIDVKKQVLTFHKMRILLAGKRGNKKTSFLAVVSIRWTFVFAVQMQVNAEICF